MDAHFFSIANDLTKLAIFSDGAYNILIPSTTHSQFPTLKISIATDETKSDTGIYVHNRYRAGCIFRATSEDTAAEVADRAPIP